ncbi:flagellar basal-body rod protein FlgG [bacterium]|nr:flagellar basal-body rod protein FlgG [bacterium]
MMRALRTAASGMYAQQLYIDTVANNLSNVNTTGFKKSTVEFQDLIYQTQQSAGSVRNLGTVIPTELQIGHGVRPVAIEKAFTQGSPVSTNAPLDLSIQGEGFFKVRKGDDTIAYTRDGNFNRSPDGRVVNADGYILEPDLIIPEDTIDIQINSEGYVNILLVGATEMQEVGQIELAKFANENGLRALGKNLYRETEASGPPIYGQPGIEGFGEVAQGFLEASNVQIVEEMVNMILAQRAYEVNSKAIKTAEEMLSLANNLKR